MLQGVSPEVDVPHSDVLFREGQTLGGHVTYTPRLIAMDVNGQYLIVVGSFFKIIILQLICHLFISYDSFNQSFVHVFMLLKIYIFSLR